MPEQIPNVEHAFIDPRKLRDYALNVEHDTGRYKAEFFMQMGYTRDDWQVLAGHSRTTSKPICRAKQGVTIWCEICYNCPAARTERRKSKCDDSLDSASQQKFL